MCCGCNVASPSCRILFANLFYQVIYTRLLTRCLSGGNLYCVHGPQYVCCCCANPLCSVPLLQFVTLAGFHALNYSMFSLAYDYARRGMSAYSELQQAEFAREKDGYAATTHQRFVGTGYFDTLAQKIADGSSSTTALTGSTEEEQFH